MSVYQPSSIDDLIEGALIELGKPVIQINVAEVQSTLCARKAIDKFCDWHYDATEHVYIAHEITPQDIENNYIETPKEVHNVLRVLGSHGWPSVHGGQVGYCGSGGNIGGARYFNQMNYGDARTEYGRSGGLVSLYLANAHRSYFNSILNPNIGMTWNKGSRRIRLEGNIRQASNGCGNFLIYEAYVINENLCLDCENPQGNGTNFFNNEWLKSYTAALIKKQWATNLSKFKNIPIANGYEFNASEIMQEAKEEIQKLEEDLETKYSFPAYMIIG